MIRASLLRQVGFPYDPVTMGPPNQSNTLTFDEPRGLAVNRYDTFGDLYISDTSRHCIICVNSMCVFKWLAPRTITKQNEDLSKVEKVRPVYPKESGARGHFSHPKDVCLLKNGWLAIADYGNQRVQVMRGHGNVRFMFETGDKPIALASDEKFTVFVLTESGMIEVYLQGGKYFAKYPLLNSNIKVTKARMTIISDKGFQVSIDGEPRKWLLLTFQSRNADLVIFEIIKNKLIHCWSGNSISLMNDVVSCQAVCVENEEIDCLGDGFMSNSSSDISDAQAENPIDEFNSQLRSSNRFQFFSNNVKGVSFLLGDMLNHCVYRCWLNIQNGHPIESTAVRLISPKDGLSGIQNMVKLPGNRLAVLIYAIRASPLNRCISRLQIYKLPEK